MRACAEQPVVLSAVRRLGAWPDALLDEALARERELSARHASLAALEQPMQNAFGLYKRTRPPASTESLPRSRTLPPPGPHPELLALAQARCLAVGGAEAGQQARIAAALKRFRPAAMVLQAAVRPLLLQCFRIA